MQQGPKRGSLYGYLYRPTILNKGMMVHQSSILGHNSCIVKTNNDILVTTWLNVETLNQQWVLLVGNTKCWSLLQRTACFFFPWPPICLSKSQDVSGNDHTHFGAAHKHFAVLLCTFWVCNRHLVH
jgi:hypothetical protein